MNRLERLRSQIADLESRRETVRTTVLELIEVEADFTDEQADQYRSLNTEFDELAPQIEGLRSELATVERVAAAPARAVEQVGLTLHTPNSDDNLRAGVEYGPPREVIASAMRAVEKADNGIAELDDRYRAGVQATLRAVHGDRAAVARHILVTSREAYRSAFPKLLDAAMRGMPVTGLTDAESEALEHVRAASLTDAAGGFAVPTPLDPTLILTGAHDGEGSVWRAISTIKQTTVNEWNGVTTAGITASFDAEASEVSDDAPTLAALNIPVHRGTAFVPFSIEVGMDWASLEADMRDLIMTAKDDVEAEHFAKVVTASNAPVGLIFSLDGTASEVAPATAETFARADLDALVNALPRRHRRNASWLADISTYNTIRGFDTAGGSALWAQLAADTPALLMGRPAYEEPYMTGTADINPAATGDNFIAVLGDFRRYFIVDRVGLSFEVIPHLFHTANNLPKGQRGLWAMWRVGAKVADVDAFRVLSIPTTA